MMRKYKTNFILPFFLLIFILTSCCTIAEAQGWYRQFTDSTHTITRISSSVITKDNGMLFSHFKDQATTLIKQ